MEWIFKLIVGIIGLCVIYAIFYAICRKFPWIRIVLALGLGVASYFVWYIWWVSLIVAFFSFGLFVWLTGATTKRGNHIICDQCGNDILDIESESDNHINYYCPKCKHRGGYILYR